HGPALLLAAVAFVAAGPAAGQTSASDASEANSAPEDTGAASTDAETQDEGRRTDPSSARKSEKLSDRIKSVQRKVFLKRRRFELYPHFGIDLNDAFYAHLVVGGSVGYHLVDAFSLEGRFGYVLDSIEQEPIRFVRRSVGALPVRPPRFELHGELDAIWAPLYGKISLFGEGILHFDTYLAVGGGVFKTDAGASPAFNFGIGQRYFINDWLVARVELRDYVFPDTQSGESDIQNLLIVNFSISAFLPTSFDYDF
ncbi:MAG: outer membrane beta-barrel domain-containing protein, partial [Myxococcota bacterium]